MEESDIRSREVATGSMTRERRRPQNKLKYERNISNKEKNTGGEIRPGVETALTGSDAAEPRHRPGPTLDWLTGWVCVTQRMRRSNWSQLLGATLPTGS
jgi:hypothetical protein